MSSPNTLASSAQMPPDIQWMHALNRVLVGMFVLTVLTACMVWIGQRPFFNITTVKLDGDLQRNNQATINANILPHLNGKQARFFAVNLAKIRSVFENLSWVRQAVVKRVWPNTLHVTLFEHQPVAFWQTGNRDDLMINIQGEIFEANTGDVTDGSLPTFKSPIEATPEQAQRMLTMYRLLVPVARALPANINTLQLTDRGSWSIKLDNDTLIELGRGQPDKVVSRAIRFVKTIRKLRPSNTDGFSFADLRYTNGYAVRFRESPVISAVSASDLENTNAMLSQPLNPQ